MPLPVIDGVFRVTLNWSYTGSEVAHNVMHFYTPTLTTDDVYDAIDGNVAAGMWDWTATGCAVTSVDITPLDGESATLSYLTSSPTKWQGAGTGQPIPQCCGIVKFQTGFRGRSARGRIYIPYVAEGETEIGYMDDAAAVQTAWATFLEDMMTAECHLTVASYKESVRRDVTSVVAETQSGTQRRRNRR